MCKQKNKILQHCVFGILRVRCRGSNSFGQLGGGLPTSYYPTPQEWKNGMTWASFTTGASVTYAIKYTDSTLWASGDNANGALGGTVTAAISQVPVEVEPNSTFSAVKAGYQATHACAVDTDGIGACWGTGGSGELGDGSADASNPTMDAIAGTVSWDTFAIGAGFTCAANGTAAVPDTVPFEPPIITNIIEGNAFLTVYYEPPDDLAGRTVAAYNVNCTNSTATVTGERRVAR